MTFPAILFGIMFFIIVVPFSVLILVLLVKGKNQSWKGEITDKLVNTKTDSDRSYIKHTYYTICIKLDDGKNVKIAVDGNKYDQWNIGDRLEKKKGQSWPEKI